MAIALPLNVFLRTLETLVEVEEDDLLSESDSELGCCGCCCWSFLENSSSRGSEAACDSEAAAAAAARDPRRDDFELELDVRGGGGVATVGDGLLLDDNELDEDGLLACFELAALEELDADRGTVDRLVGVAGGEVELLELGLLDDLSWGSLDKVSFLNFFRLNKKNKSS